MIIDIIKHFARFVALLFLQVFIISKLNISTYINPNILVYLLILMPVNQLPAATLILSFFAGLILDMFTDTPGYASTAMLVAGFIRIFYLRAFTHIDVIESGVIPNVVNMGLRWFFFYAVTIIAVFHITLGFVQMFNFSYLFGSIVESLASGIFTFIMVMLAEFLFYRSKLVG